MTTLLLLRHATRPLSSLASLAGERSAAAAVTLAETETRVAAEATVLEAELHAAAGAKAGGDNPEAARRRLTLLAIRRDVHNRRPPRENDIAAAGGDLLPPVAARLIEHLRSLDTLRAAEAAWRDALLTELSDGRRGLVAAVGEPRMALGIELAGRSLAGKIRALAARPPESWGHGERHVAAKALAYLARCATKTSPNSLFCATALAWAKGPRVALEGAADILAIDCVLSVAEARKIACVLAADPTVEAAVIPRANPTLREEDGGFSFWRFASLRNANDDESYSRVRDHPVLRVALDESAARRPLPELRRRIAVRCGLEESVIGPFLRQMIERGVLIGEIEIPYNERRPLRFVARRVRDAGSDAPWVEPSLAVEDEVDRLAGMELGSVDLRVAMARIAGTLAELPHTRALNEDELFRIDAASTLAATLPDSVLDELRSGLRPYTRLFAALYPKRRYLQGWVDRFLARFPADHDVPLLEVYRVVTEQDDTYRPAAFPEPSEDASAGSLTTRGAMTAVRDHLAAAARATSAGDEIPLDDAVLDRLLPGTLDPPWACGVLFQIAAKDHGAISGGAYRLVLNGLFHGAGLSLSRFAHLLGAGTTGDANPVVRELRRAWSVLERPGAIVAELTYNHLGRTANAGLRPAIFPYEIELPGDCASPGAAALGLGELIVRWDVEADRFVMRRVPDGVEVLPVVNSGVNPVGFVSFLVAIGEQALQPVGYFPGFDTPGVTHWPRVVSGQLILFREHWVFRRGEWPDAPARGDDPVPFARDILSWKARWRLPRHVFVHTSTEPKPRYIDLDAPVFLDLLRRELTAIGADADATVHVAEMLPGPDALWAQGCATEFLVQMNGGGHPASSSEDR